MLFFVEGCHEPLRPRELAASRFHILFGQVFLVIRHKFKRITSHFIAEDRFWLNAQLI
jgi:hypothetical protein